VVDAAAADVPAADDELPAADELEVVDSAFLLLPQAVASSAMATAPAMPRRRRIVVCTVGISLFRSGRRAR
jgi:hypothetical protein